MVGDELVIVAAYADEGPTLKRWRARARGRVARIKQAHVPHHRAGRDARLERQRACPPAGRVAEERVAEAEAQRPSASRAREPRSPPRRRAAAQAKTAAGAPHPEEGKLMGQKVHPGAMRVGVIHDWKSNWYTGKKEYPQYLIEDIKIRDHIQNKLGHAGHLRHPDPQGQAADHGRHLHRAPRDRDRQVGRRGRRAP